MTDTIETLTPLGEAIKQLNDYYNGHRSHVDMLALREIIEHIDRLTTLELHLLQLLEFVEGTDGTMGLVDMSDPYYGDCIDWALIKSCKEVLK